MSLLPHSLTFTVYMSAFERDLDILMRAGHVQRYIAEAGQDTPAAWFARAAETYPDCDDSLRMARRAMELVSAQLSAEVPS